VDGLTDKQRAFVEHYLVCWNASEAARRASYTGKANVVGPRLLANVSIQAAIQERLSALAMSADEVLARLTAQARGSMTDFLDDDGKIDLAQAREHGALHLIKSRSVTKDGERIELYDAQNALELLGKYHRLWTDKVEHSGPNGGPLTVREVIIEVPADEPLDANE
jgi:phage terminase small subunit